jgi:hypothetical protein
VSHSKDDPNLPFFYKAFGGSPVKGVFMMELEGIKPPPWSTIKDAVSASAFTFVLLSKPLKEMNYAHTRNWIDFEVGLSCAQNKPVWVFEPEGQEVEFAVPYCNYYCIYNPAEPSEVIRVKRYNDMLSGVVGPNWGITRAPLARCAKDNCQLEFHVMFKEHNIEPFPCPSCRTRLRWGDPPDPSKGWGQVRETQIVE